MPGINQIHHRYDRKRKHELKAFRKRTKRRLYNWGWGGKALHRATRREKKRKESSTQQESEKERKRKPESLGILIIVLFHYDLANRTRWSSKTPQFNFSRYSITSGLY